MRIHLLVIDVFDPKSDFGTAVPIVRHEFPGKDRQECTERFEAHLEGDAILRGCVRGESSCVVDSRWETLEVPNV